jgi:hypothetical protein
MPGIVEPKFHFEFSNYFQMHSVKCVSCPRSVNVILREKIFAGKSVDAPP